MSCDFEVGAYARMSLSYPPWSEPPGTALFERRHVTIIGKGRVLNIHTCCTCCLQTRSLCEKMAQSNLRQFYTVRKRPYAEHGTLKRRKLTEDSRLDIPCLDEGADPLSLPTSEPVQVSTADTAAKSKTTSTRR